MRYRLTMLALIATAFASPALAQDGSDAVASRTPAKAQQFLAAIPPMLVGAKYLAVVSAVSSTDACKTVFTVQKAKLVVGTQWAAEDGAPVEQITLDWSDVEAEKTTDESGYVSFTLTTSRSAYTKAWNLYYAAPATRDRMYAAAQYLHGACDKTKELGF